MNGKLLGFKIFWRVKEEGRSLERYWNKAFSPPQSWKRQLTFIYDEYECNIQMSSNVQMLTDSVALWHGPLLLKLRTDSVWQNKKDLIFFNGSLVYLLGFPGGSDGNESACNAGYLGFIPGLRRSLEKGIATHSSIPVLENPKDRGARQATVHGIAESDMTE